MSYCDIVKKEVESAIKKIEESEDLSKTMDEMRVNVVDALKLTGIDTEIIQKTTLISSLLLSYQIYSYIDGFNKASASMAGKTIDDCRIKELIINGLKKSVDVTVEKLEALEGLRNGF